MAIILVFLWHYRRYGSPEWLAGISKFGWTGVDLFFVLSGYLIGSQLFGELIKEDAISISNFYSRRFFRILPAYLVVLIFYFSVPVFSERDGISPLWKFLTFTMNFGLDYQNAGSFSHAWSLCIEEQFYLLFPLVIILLSKIKLKHKTALVLSVLFIFGFAARIYSWQTHVAPVYTDKENMSSIGNAYSMYVYYPTYNRLDGLLTGIFIAVVFCFKPGLKEKIQAKGNVLFLIGIAVLTTTYFLCAEQFSFSTAVFSYPLVSVGYGLLVLAALSPGCFLNRFNLKIFSVLATLSYSVYLTHKQLNRITQELLQPYHLNENILILTCFAVSLFGGLILYMVIEKPFLYLRDKLIKQESEQVIACLDTREIHEH
jgi:peptidoglycan/LPS O-acetylase OafA/YrhL